MRPSLISGRPSRVSGAATRKWQPSAISKSAAQRRAMHRCDHRLRHLIDRRDHVDQARRLRRLAELGDVGAGDERASRRCDDDRCDACIRACFGDAFENSRAHFMLERVDWRIVDDDHRNFAVATRLHERETRVALLPPKLGVGRRESDAHTLSCDRSRKPLPVRPANALVPSVRNYVLQVDRDARKCCDRCQLVPHIGGRFCGWNRRTTNGACPATSWALAIPNPIENSSSLSPAVSKFFARFPRVKGCSEIRSSSRAPAFPRPRSRA